MPHRILIADDEEMLTELLSAHLQNCGYLTSVARNSEEVLEQLKLSPSLILLDINMPGKDGLELCKEIRGQVTCPILFLTARISEEDAVIGLQAGGDDYITKPFRLQELTARIAAHLRRDERVLRTSSELLASRGLLADFSARKIYWEGQELRFSRREFDILEFLMTHPGQVFDRERMYESIWGYEAEGDSRVIKEHIRKIRNKLQEATGKDYIETIWGIGYRWKT